ncbi:hypothetical protein [Candidatus Solirubrobacter pratensis]|uniref:hypothetical protein n=1 Tax=Candidatus Solirubrobacter pratensis TaxID=1298857 RepID=UPI00041C3D29|nr:hypothetical protein [Candidatus Solirubrobacter pratensis]
MDLYLSPGMLRYRPEVTSHIRQIKDVAVRLDRDIRLRGLRVEVTRNPHFDRYSGWAVPEVHSRSRQGYITHAHPDGLITLRIGDECGDEDIIRLTAHELRHIGQFHRGRKRYGVMTTAPLDHWESERDAEGFEDRVLERM